MGVRLEKIPLLVLMTGAVAVAMALPAAHATIHSDHHVARSFFYSGFIILVLTGLVAIVTAGQTARNPARSHLVALIWAYLVLPVVMALPLTEAMPDIGWFDLWFEMISAFTTTGASVFDRPLDVPASVHLWRAQVGWMGGFVMLVAAVAVMAPMNLGGMEVISGRLPGRSAEGLSQITGSVDPARRLLAQAAAIFPAYAGVTALLWLALILSGDVSLVAFCHALSTLSTSGISPVGGMDGSASGRWGELFVALALCFGLSRRFWPGAGMRGIDGPIWRDPELQLAAGVLVAVTAILFLRHAVAAEEYAGFGSGIGALWGTVFTTVSFLTTTGFISTDWEVARFWSGLETPGLVLAGLAIIGGGIATTAGGVKLLRVYALFRHGQREMERLVHPNSVGGAGHSARRLRREGAYAAWVFFMLFALGIAAGIAALTVVGQNFNAALALTLSALSNTGQLAAVAADAPLTYAALSPVTKLVLGALMLIGRLETVAILVILSPGGWQGGWLSGDHRRQ